MIDTQEKLAAACRDAGVLFSVDAVWAGAVPDLVRFRCESRGASPRCSSRMRMRSQQFAGAIVGHVLGTRQPPDEQAAELAAFFHLRYLEEVRAFVAHDPEWDEGIAALVRGIESGGA